MPETTEDAALTPADLSKRLRHGREAPYFSWLHALAADRIDAQAAEITALRAELKSLSWMGEGYAHLEAERDRLRAERDALQASHASVSCGQAEFLACRDAEIAKLKAERDALAARLVVPGEGELDRLMFCARLRHTSAEMDEEGVENADWQGGYDATLTEVARRLCDALTALRARVTGLEGARAGIYMASKAHHGPMWQRLRAEGWPIISTWIDEAGVGATSNWPDLWSRCTREAASAEALIVYREDGEILKGAWVEVGAALAAGVPVFAVGCENFSVRHHPGVRCFASLAEARAALSPSAAQEARDAE